MYRLKWIAACTQKFVSSSNGDDQQLFMEMARSVSNLIDDLVGHIDYDIVWSLSYVHF